MTEDDKGYFEGKIGSAVAVVTGFSEGLALTDALEFAGIANKPWEESKGAYKDESYTE